MTEDDILNQHEAARLLGVTARRFRQMVQQKWINPISRGKYDANDVMRLKRLRERKLSVTQAAVMAQRAELSSRQTERLVKLLLSVLDIGAGLLSLEKEDVEALHLKVEDELCMFYPMSIEEVSQWIRIFNSIGDEYFEAVELHLGTEEPWIPYWRLAVKMCKEAPRERLRTDPHLGLAYNCLDKARRHISQVSYLYTKHRHGKVTALNTFRDASGDAHDDIVSIAIYHSNEKKKQRQS